MRPVIVSLKQKIVPYCVLQTDHPLMGGRRRDIRLYALGCNQSSYNSPSRICLNSKAGRWKEVGAHRIAELSAPRNAVDIGHHPSRRVRDCAIGLVAVAIIENPVSSTQGGPSVAKNIPSEADPGSDPLDAIRKLEPVAVVFHESIGNLLSKSRAGSWSEFRNRDTVVLQRAEVPEVVIA